ncbi:MAG: TldD/PmbA family protein, partial [Solobacterium sp.]|nr:TldD/PmbA family protein [Solobacterium sp.]
EVLGKLNAHSLASGTYPIILERRAMTALFSALADIFSGDLISKGISPLKDKLNEKIFSDLITIIDDPKNLDAVRVANYDDEGCPTRKKILVDKGEFKVILHNTKSAMRMNGESTGNGFKGSYASPVSISPMNCYIEAGEKSLEELCMEMQEGFVITSLAGLHAGIDFVTTNFSLQCAGYYVKEGKRDHSVTLVTVAANFLDLMNKVVSVGNDLEWKLNSVACPSIYFSSCAISGE